jgi:hypothetical protein
VQSSSAAFVAKLTLTNLCRAHLLHLLQSLHSPICAELICCICCKANNHQFVQSSSAAFVAKLTLTNLCRAHLLLCRKAYTHQFVQSSSAAFVAKLCPCDSVQQMMLASGLEPEKKNFFQFSIILYEYF